MDLGSLLSMGAGLIQGNSDEATSGLDTSSIADALGGLLGGGEGGGLDLGSIVGSLTGSAGESGGLMETVGSWIGNGENAAIEPDQIGDLLGGEKISAFAESLGISVDSAKQALADALPEVVNQATPEGDSDMLGNLLASVGGAEGAIGMVGKLFGR
jgi:uncharacterized protein YidB (DUF937 family)